VDRTARQRLRHHEASRSSRSPLRSREGSLPAAWLVALCAEDPLLPAGSVAPFGADACPTA
jgi:hypothetical protein